MADGRHNGYKSAAIVRFHSNFAWINRISW